MNIPSWLPLKTGRSRPENAAEEAAAGARASRASGCGPITGRDLGDVASLVSPFAKDPFYRLRPPFSREAAELSMELAQMTYTLELEPWMEAGWNDFSIQIDDTLQSGITRGSSADGERMRDLISALKVRRSKAALRERNPVSQVMSALRQRERSDTIKAVCMMHSLPDGRYLLAIGFMGTGKRFYDWISNFRFTTEDGFHKGFHQLCAYFEEGAESIVFPRTAAELGLEKLTLGEVLAEMTSLSSRFRLWMAGHSQGGAVMQVFCHRLMMDWGVLAQNIVGYGFASPTVATGRLVYDPAAYPLYHILNSDDMVPRMGAVLHLGLCLEYPADDTLRERCYEWSSLPADVAAREALRPFQKEMTDTASVLSYGTAFLRCLAEEKGAEGINALVASKWSIPAVDRVIVAAGDKAMDMMERFIKNAQNGYLALTGHPMDEETHLMERMRPIVRRFSFRRLAVAIASYCLPPHHIMYDGNRKEGAYAHIVKEGLGELRPFIWRNPRTGAPWKQYASAMPEAVPETLPMLPARQRHPARGSAVGKCRLSLSSRRAQYGDAKRTPRR